MNPKEYAVLPPDRSLVTEFEKQTLQEAQVSFAQSGGPGWKLVRASNYPSGQDSAGIWLYPTFAVLKVKREGT